MILKFLKNEQTCEITNIEFLSGEQVKIFGTNIPLVEGGFDIYFENGVIDNLYNQFTTVYEQADNYVIFTSDENTYYTYLIYDAETGYVSHQITTTESELPGAALRFAGRGKEYQIPEVPVFMDEDGFPIYKIVGDEVVQTTAEDKAPFLKKREEEEFETAMSNKIQEIETACKAAIIEGVIVGEGHFSYGTEDQSNIFNAVTLATQTGLAVPYHADGESCRLFTKEEIVSIYVAQETNLTHNITYHNQLKLYLKTLQTKEEIEAICYGETELTGDYLATYMMIMAQAQEVIKHFIGENPAGAVAE